MKRKFLMLITILSLIVVLVVFSGCKKDEEENKSVKNETSVENTNNEQEDDNENIKSVNESNANTLKNEVLNNTTSENLADALSYEELSNKIVISYGDSFDVIYHHSNGKITAQICEYTLADESEAKSFLMYLQSSETISEVKDMNQSGNKVTVIFSESAYKDLTIDDVKESYDILNDTVKNDDVTNSVTNETNTNKVENTTKVENKAKN